MAEATTFSRGGSAVGTRVVARRPGIRPPRSGSSPSGARARASSPRPTAHLTEVTRLDPQDRAAWLSWAAGCTTDAGTTRNRSPHRKPTRGPGRGADPLAAPPGSLEGWLADPSRQSEAVRELAQVHEPRAVPSVVRVFDGAPKWQRWAVYLLGRIDAAGRGPGPGFARGQRPERAIREVRDPAPGIVRSPHVCRTADQLDSASRPVTRSRGHRQDGPIRSS